jgi:aminopeptidase N
VGYAEVGWLYVRDRIDSAFTIIREDALAFPMVGGLSFAANRRMPTRSFTYDVSVRVPQGFVVASGGEQTRASHDDGSETWRYVTRVPRGFVNIAVAPFGTMMDNGVRLFYLEADSVGARRIMASAQAALGALSEWFGPQRRPIELTITEIPDGWGSQADLVAGIIQSAAAFRDPDRLGELYHELAHLWNVADLDKPSPRWNEGYATFMEDILRERIDGWRGRRDGEARTIATVKRMLAADSALRTTAMIDYGRRDMTGRSYWVGGIMFALLYELVGERAFNQIIGGYYREFENGGSTRQLVDFAKTTAGRDLSAFFDDWLFTARWTALLPNATSIADLAAQYRTTR